MARKYKNYEDDTTSEANWNAAAEYSKLGITAIQHNFDAMGTRDPDWQIDIFTQKLNLVWPFLNEEERKEMVKEEDDIITLKNDYNKDLNHVQFMNSNYSINVPPNGASDKLIRKLTMVDRRMQELFKIHKLTIGEAEEDIGL